MELAELKYPILGAIDEYGASPGTTSVQYEEVIKTSLQNTMDGMKGKIVLSEQLEKVEIHYFMDESLNYGLRTVIHRLNHWQVM